MNGCSWKPTNQPINGQLRGLLLLGVSSKNGTNGHQHHHNTPHPPPLYHVIYMIPMIPGISIRGCDRQGELKHALRRAQQGRPLMARYGWGAGSLQGVHRGESVAGGARLGARHRRCGSRGISKGRWVVSDGTGVTWRYMSRQSTGVDVDSDDCFKVRISW